ncbi:inositol pentakisphosphate 2-kinase-like protein [Chaetomium sp. MPI-CAGE-AT-0009]|nr:inositol pentakisphosphate 2-kinase-like protein [Chaetomium sp. MPI-CAGE-AT-0009]
MSPTNTSCIPVLSFLATGNYEFKFVGEGAANVVFEVIAPPGDEHSSIFQGYLLRVPKAETKAHNYVELQEYWETVVAPLFGHEELVQQRLVKLGSEEVASRLNATLELKEETRRPDFRGSRVAIAEYGMLVEDMRQRHTDDLTLEFKPKWLAQSRHAPLSATRCRTCAREALRQHSKPHAAKKRTPLCPLNLLACATSPTALAHVTAQLSTLAPLTGVCPASTATTTTTIPPTQQQQQQQRQQRQQREQRQQQQQHARLTTWLRTNALLPRLRAAQLAHDDDDDDGANPSRVALAMTLRDCACFVRVPADAGQAVEAKLGDLDRKNWEAKMGYWREMEGRLVEGGFYEGREEGVEGVETDCLLERGVEGGEGMEV